MLAYHLKGMHRIFQCSPALLRSLISPRPGLSPVRVASNDIRRSSERFECQRMCHISVLWKVAASTCVVATHRTESPERSTFASTSNPETPNPGGNRVRSADNVTASPQSIASPLAKQNPEINRTALMRLWDLVSSLWRQPAPGHVRPLVRYYILCSLNVQAPASQ